MSLNATIPTLEGDAGFGAYVASPESTPRGAIIVIQEIFGVNPGIRQKCDKLAAEGYLAVAPDLFWRIEPGIELDPDVEPEFQRALGLFGEFDQDIGIRDIEATIHHIRRTLSVAKVGCVGYCLGGRLAYMTAARTDIDASVGYYGVGIDGLLHEKHAIAHPLMLHIPTEDGFVPRETQQAMHAGSDNHPRVTLHDYEGLDHGFATEHGKRRNEEAANLADGRTAAFFAEHLGVKAAALLALALIAAPAAAQVGPQPMFDAGEELEVELHDDFNGDGHADVAYIVRGEDRRELRVATTFITEVEIGENPPQVLALDPYPLGTAQLSAKDSAKSKVLVFEDLTGGTTAVASTHRFRWDAKLEAMRLIGLDATLYSRTYAHDGKEASWNLLTGDLVTRTLRLNKGLGDASYDKVGETKRKKPSAPLKLEDSPSGDDLLGWPGAT